MIWLALLLACNNPLQGTTFLVDLTGAFVDEVAGTASALARVDYGSGAYVGQDQWSGSFASDTVIGGFSGNQSAGSVIVSWNATFQATRTP